MSRLQSIENRLKTLNGAVFQELCDSYLTIRDIDYLAISRTGSQTGKQKTKRGTPDTFFQLPNGNFIYVETTTDISTKNKLTNDIKACFDPNKTKVPIEKIQEIILCFNWDIDQEKINELREIAQEYKANIRVRCLMLQKLAIELHYNHRDLVHQYLGLPLDTGQIVSIENFKKEYDRASKGIASTLSNPFFHREEELQQLNKALENYDFIILTGAPGVGKTKLAIEGMNDYLKNNHSYEAFCVSYKSHTLLDDLYQYFDTEKDYLLFVDDANRIDAFEQITGFFKANRKGRLKIILTVRDYAFHEVEKRCYEFLTQKIEINKLSDEQITDIIKSKPFEILNSKFQKKIIRISDGNPRIAIMSSLLAKKKQDISVLQNVSDLFEKYFSTFTKDEEGFENNLNLKCLGIIAFFFTIPYKDRLVVESILGKFDISYGDFIDAVDKLDKLELVEIQFDYIKISEQNLSTFFFYKVFIKDDLLSFSTLLENYFEEYKNRFTDCVIPANNTFGPQNVMDKIKPSLLQYWSLIKEDTDKSIELLNSFWFYLGDQAFEFVYNINESLIKPESPKYEIKYENNHFNNSKDIIIELLGNFFRFNDKNLQDSIELLVEYIYRKPEKLSELIHKIKGSLIFEEEDERYGFYRQNTLFNFLIEGVNNKDELLIILFYELSKTFLGHYFRQTKGGRNNSIVMYNYPIPNNKDTQEFRRKIWDTVHSNFMSNPERAIDLLKKTSKPQIDTTKEVMEFDIPFVLNIINTHLVSSDFEHCKYVQEQIRWLRRKEFNFPQFDKLREKFVNDTYKTYLKLDWDRFRDKESYEFDDFRKYEQLKEEEIRNSFVFSTIDEINDFYKTFTLLKNIAKNNINYGRTLDFIIDENLLKSQKVGLNIVLKIIGNNNDVKYVPRITFMNHLKDKKTADKIWEIIQKSDFNLKANWELSFYYYINDNLIDDTFPNHIFNTFSKVDLIYSISFDKLSRYLKEDSHLFQKLLKIIIEKNDQEDSKIQIWEDFFVKYFENLGDDIELIKKAYIQQKNIYSHFDSRGYGFLKILEIDNNFLLEYIEHLYASTSKHSLSGDHSNMSFVWGIENIEEILNKVFDLVIKEDTYYGILEHYCNVFFYKINNENHLDRADNFIRNYVVENSSDYKKIEIIVDLTRHSRKELFEEVFLLFLSKNQDVIVFSKIKWIGNGGTYNGDVIIGDVKASEWRNILEIVSKSSLGYKLIPIRNYIKNQIESHLNSGDWERKRKFLSKDL